MPIELDSDTTSTTSSIESSSTVDPLSPPKSEPDTQEHIEPTAEHHFVFVMGLSLVSLFKNQTALLTLPILVVVIVASLDNADKQLMAASFPMLERTLGLDVKTLGYFSMFTNLSYALSLPFWGYMVHTHGMSRIHLLLGGACFSWGITTAAIAVAGKSIAGQAVFRALNGFALGSILPLSQTLLVELVQISMRGRAFGLMNLCEQLAGTLAAASIVYLDPRWEIPYYGLGALSCIMGWVAHGTLTQRKIKQTQKQHSNYDDNSKETKEEEGAELTLKQIIQRIIQIPTFICLVAQGIFGGTPWEMMSFLLLLMDWRGFTKEQIVTIQFTTGLTATIGGYLGGLLGDFASQHFYGTRGRILLGVASVFGGIPLYGLFLYSESYVWALLWGNAFRLWGTWTPSGALRPICADLTRNASERAQIIAMWIVLEKACGAILGAPLVGYLTSNMLSEDESGNQSNNEKAHALAFNLFMLSSLFWFICGCFWLATLFTLRKKEASQQEPAKPTRGDAEAGNIEMNALL